MVTRAKDGRPLKLAVVGCGAVTEFFHLPAIMGSKDVELTLLVDRDTERARALARRCADVAVAADHREVEGRADAAIVAVPHHLHAPIAVDLMQTGVDVLVEKPMAGSVEDCDAMIEAAARYERTLAVGMQRRFSNGANLVKSVLDSGLLGRVQNIDLREGAVYGWPVRDAGMFDPKIGGGVVTGSGIHSLDLLLWWMGEAESVDYRDDALGGVEADCEFDLVFPGGTRAAIEFSRTRALRNTWRLEGEHGHLIVGTGPQPQVSLQPARGRVVIAGSIQFDRSEAETPWTLLERQLADFVRAVREGHPPRVSGEEGRRAIAVMETGRLSRGTCRLPWLTPSTERDGPNSKEVRAHA